MSHKMLHEMRDIYTTGIHDADLIEEEIVTTISYGMFYEGKTALEVIDFLADSEGNEIIEKFEEILDNVDKENITESTVFSEEVETFVEEQAQQLDEIVGATLRVGAAALRGFRFAKGAKGLAPLARLGGAAKKTKQAIGVISKQGIRKSSVVRKALEPITSKIKAGAQAVKSKIPQPVKGFIKAAAVPAAAAGAGYMLGKRSAGDGAKPAPEAPSTSASGADTTPAYPGGQTKDQGKKIDKEYEKLRSQSAKTKDPEAVKKAEKYGKEQWAKLYPKLAAKVKPDGTQMGTGQSQMEKDAEDIRRMQQRSKQRQGEEMGGPEGPGTIDKADVEASIKAQQERDKKRAEKQKATSEAYDVVLEYLLSQGHADTVEEAHYVMMQMDAENIQSIVEQMMPPIDPEKHKQAQKTQKIYNKASQGAGSEKDFLKKTGPQLPGV